MNDFQKDLFVSECMRLESFIRMYASTYSDREVAAVIVEILIENTRQQENPRRAMDQIISSLNEGLEEDDQHNQ